MIRTCKIFENDDYKFMDFFDILADIRDSFLHDMCRYDIEIPMNVNSRLNKSYIRHSTLEQILNTYIYVDTSKTNVIVIPNDLTMTSGGHFITDDEFVANVLRTVDTCKRNIPLLIKRVDSPFSDLAEFVKGGEGVEFLHQVDADKEKLKGSTVSFAEFKKFARSNKLRFILENLIDKIEFKRLFMS